MSKPNPYCEALGIDVPRLEVAKNRPDANYYSLLIVALLERGETITLEQAAKRFEEAGLGPRDQLLASLKRCKPARPPIYRDGDRYALDPHDDEADLWVFRLGLRPAKAAPLRVVRPQAGTLPVPDASLTLEHLDEAWRDGIPNAWSAQRIAICVLDAHGRAMTADEVLGFLRARGLSGVLSKKSAQYWRRGAAIRVHNSGLWELDIQHDAVRSARRAIRERVERARRWADMRPDPAVIEANRKRIERERQAHAEKLANMRRVLVYGFPSKKPEALVLLDVQQREIATFLGDEITEATRKLGAYDKRRGCGELRPTRDARDCHARQLEFEQRPGCDGGRRPPWASTLPRLRGDAGQRHQCRAQLPALRRSPKASSRPLDWDYAERRGPKLRPLSRICSQSPLRMRRSTARAAQPRSTPCSPRRPNASTESSATSVVGTIGTLQRWRPAVSSSLPWWESTSR